MTIEREDGPRAAESDIVKYITLLQRQEDECRQKGDIFNGAGYARIRRTLIDGYLPPVMPPEQRVALYDAVDGIGRILELYRDGETMNGLPVTAVRRIWFFAKAALAEKEPQR